MAIRLIVPAAVLAVASFGLSGVATAHTADTPVGRLTATQADGPCNDLGAVVTVSVANGFANAAYTATPQGPGGQASFSTNGSGSGSGIAHNVLPPGGWTGTATFVVTANGQSGTVTAAIECVDPHG